MSEMPFKKITIRPKQAPGMPNSGGFTLLELMVVMAIVGILLAIAIPSYKYVANSNRIAAEVNGLVGDMEFARSEAIKEGNQVVVCVSSDGASCTSNNSWDKGWIVFSDINNNGTYDSGTDLLLRSQSTFTSSDTFTGNPSTLTSVLFNREGFSTNLPASALITLHALTATTSSTRCLSLTALGYMTVMTYGGSCT